MGTRLTQGAGPDPVSAMMAYRKFWPYIAGVDGLRGRSSGGKACDGCGAWQLLGGVCVARDPCKHCWSGHPASHSSFTLALPFTLHLPWLPGAVGHVVWVCRVGQIRGQNAAAPSTFLKSRFFGVGDCGSFAGATLGPRRYSGCRDFIAAWHFPCSGRISRQKKPDFRH